MSSGGGTKTKVTTAEESMIEPPYDYEGLKQVEAQFDNIVRPVEMDVNEDGRPDVVILDDGVKKSEVKYDSWVQGCFNYLDQQIDRDDSQKVENNKQLIDLFNSYQFEGENIHGSGIGTCMGYFLTAATAGSWLLARRRTVPPGHFGHCKKTPKLSASLYMLVLFVLFDFRYIDHVFVIDYHSSPNFV